jgi:hypothetical protein
MPRIDILAELRSVIQTNDNLNQAINDFTLEMKNLKEVWNMFEEVRS